MIRKIDSHHHFWHYNPAEYEWIDDSMHPLRRDFSPPDLQSAMLQTGVEAVVSVQVRQTTLETEWLLSLAAQHAWIAGVVGWGPLSAPTIEDWLQEWAGHPKLRALRHVVQGESDPEFMLRPAFQNGIRALSRFHLVYDILIYERQMKPAIALVSSHPDQRFVLDHIAKPRIREKLLEPWRTNLQELARRENVYCKLSGLITEADWEHWTLEDLRPYLDTALDAFGPKRLMLGSDWPVCLLAGSYVRWWETLENWMEPLTQSERLHLQSETAIKAYRLQV